MAACRKSVTTTSEQNYCVAQGRAFEPSRCTPKISPGQFCPQVCPGLPRARCHRGSENTENAHPDQDHYKRYDAVKPRCTFLNNLRKNLRLPQGHRHSLSCRVGAVQQAHVARPQAGVADHDPAENWQTAPGPLDVLATQE